MNIVAAQRITLAHPIKGGMEVQADTLYRGFVARGHHVEIITTSHPTSQRETEEPHLCTHYLPHSDYRRYTSAWWRASYEKLEELVHCGRADVLLSQSAGALGYLRRAHRELRLPAVVVLHASFSEGLHSQWRAAHTRRGLLRFAYTLGQLPLHYVLWRRAAAVAQFVVTTDEGSRDARATLGVDPARLRVIPNGVDTRHFTPSAERRAATRMKLGLAPEAPVAIAVTRLVPEKGVQVALRALATVPALTLLVAGDGPYAQTLRRQARKLGVGARVHFLGFVPREVLPHYLAAADLFVMPTLCHEGFPLSLAEAMASQLAPVVSNLGGIPTAVSSERTGLLVPPGDPEALGRALSRLAQDPERRAELGAAARAEAQARFTADRMVDDTLEALTAAMDNRGRWS